MIQKLITLTGTILTGKTPVKFLDLVPHRRIARKINRLGELAFSDSIDQTSGPSRFQHVKTSIDIMKPVDLQFEVALENATHRTDKSIFVPQIWEIGEER